MRACCLHLLPDAYFGMCLEREFCIVMLLHTRLSHDCNICFASIELTDYPDVVADKRHTCYVASTGLAYSTAQMNDATSAQLTASASTYQQGQQHWQR